MRFFSELFRARVMNALLVTTAPGTPSICRSYVAVRASSRAGPCGLVAEWGAGRTRPGKCVRVV